MNFFAGDGLPCDIPGGDEIVGLQVEDLGLKTREFQRKEVAASIHLQVKVGIEGEVCWGTKKFRRGSVCCIFQRSA